MCDGSSMHSGGPDSVDWNALTATVREKIPPLWDLSNYVAVNPFLGFASRPWLAAAAEIADGVGADFLPGVEFYMARWREKAISPNALKNASSRCGLGGDFESLVEILEGRSRISRRPATAWKSSPRLRDERTRALGGSGQPLDRTVVARCTRRREERSGTFPMMAAVFTPRGARQQALTAASKSQALQGGGRGSRGCRNPRKRRRCSAFSRSNPPHRRWRASCID